MSLIWRVKKYNQNTLPADWRPKSACKPSQRFRHKSGVKCVKWLVVQITMKHIEQTTYPSPSTNVIISQSSCNWMHCECISHKIVCQAICNTMGLKCKLKIKTLSVSNHKYPQQRQQYPHEGQCQTIQIVAVVTLWIDLYVWIHQKLKSQFRVLEEQENKNKLDRSHND